MEFTVDIQIDKSGLKELKKNLKQFEKEIHVGVIDNAEEAKIASLQHFGGDAQYERGLFAGEWVSIPPRPFIAFPMELHSGWAVRKSAEEKLKDLSKQSIKDTQERIGELCADDIKEIIDNDKADFGYRNSERTILTKGFDHPLLDTGKMRDSIKYEVVSK